MALRDAIWLLLTLLVFLIALWVIPKKQTRRLSDIKSDERLKIENESRKVLAEILGGTFVIIGLVFTWQTVKSTSENLRISQESLKTSQEGQITERFTRSIEQLGKVDEKGGEGNLAIRLGGIRGLERLASDSERDYWPIMEVLTTFVREHSQWKEPKKGLLSEQIGEPKPDIKAILNVLGRRSKSYQKGEDRRLDLSGTDLRRGGLDGINFDGVDFTWSHLESARLKGIQLKNALLTGAYLSNADLEQAQLDGADLTGANLTGTNLVGASLINAQLNGANFQGTILNKTVLAGVNLKDVRNLTREQIRVAITDNKTLLPDNF